MKTDLPVTVIGIGPVGLAAAAHLITRIKAFPITSLDGLTLQSRLRDIGRSQGTSLKARTQ